MTEAKLQDIIQHYKQHRAAHPESWILYCAQQDSIEEAIYYAAIARNEEGKKTNINGD